MSRGYWNTHFMKLQDFYQRLYQVQIIQLILRIADTASVFKKQKSRIWTTKELICLSSLKLLSLMLPESVWGDSLVVEEVEHKNILIILVSLCSTFFCYYSFLSLTIGWIVIVGKFGLSKQFEIWVILWDEDLVESYFLWRASFVRKGLWLFKNMSIQARHSWKKTFSKTDIESHWLLC